MGSSPWSHSRLNLHYTLACWKYDELSVLRHISITYFTGKKWHLLIRTIKRWKAATPRVQETIHRGCTQHWTDHLPEPANVHKMPVFTRQQWVEQPHTAHPLSKKQLHSGSLKRKTTNIMPFKCFLILDKDGLEQYLSDAFSPHPCFFFF